MRNSVWSARKGGILVAAIAIAVGLLVTHLSSPATPQLDWERVVLPLAQKYAESTSSSSSSSSTPLQGKIIVITGATNGIGLALTRKLSQLGGTVVALGRSSSKLKQLQQEIPSVRTFEMDLADLAAVARGADEMVAALKESGIDILINNAGMHAGFDLLGSREGLYDRVFVVNYLSHFLLTEKLAPLLLQSKRPVLAQMSSSYHWAVDGSDLVPEGAPGSDVTMPIAARPGGSHGFFFFRGQRGYANSKLAQIYHARSLKHLPAFASVRVVSICPGFVATGIVRDSPVAMFVGEKVAFSADGWGIASTLHALFDADPTPGEIPARNGNSDWYTNTDILRLAEIFIPRETPSWLYSILPLRDIVVVAMAPLMLFLQGCTAHAGPRVSSPESYNQTRANELYNWSKSAVAQYL